MIQQKDAKAPAKFAELCSGLGGWSHGLHVFGFRPEAMVELNPVTADLAAKACGLEERTGLGNVPYSVCYCGQCG